MANYSNKAQVTTGISSHSQLNLSGTHVTTSNFMEFSVANTYELVPDQSIEIGHRLFSRLEPMPVPTMGRGRINKRAYFVPYRTVFPAWNDFITDAQHLYPDGTTSLISQVHSIGSKQILFAFNDSRLAVPAPDSADDQDVDVVIILDANTIYRKNFTPLGRRAYKLMRSLGYSVDFNALTSAYQVSALPLLCVLKVYLDWYFPQNYVQAEIYNKMDAYTRTDGQLTLTSENLIEIFQFLSFVNYDADLFVSAWDHPNMPNDFTYSPISFKNIDEIEQGANLTEISGFSQVSTDTQSPILSFVGDKVNQYMLTALRSLSDYMKRHQLAGARALDRYLARFGVRLAAEKLNRSVYIGNGHQPLQFGDVTSTSDTDGAQLGSYAGKGISNDYHTYNFHTDEYGMLVIISTIIPETSYYQGTNRVVKHLSKTDFWTPEFDNLGVQAVASDEVYMPMDARKLYSNSTYRSLNYKDYVFGFVPRYAELKVPYNIISGDYILGSKNTGKESWTLARNLDNFIGSRGADGVVHDFDFIRGVDARQYDRIFYNTDDTADKFNIIHQFDVKTTFPGKSLYDTYQFENEDEAPKQTIEVGGVKSN